MTASNEVKSYDPSRVVVALAGRQIGSGKGLAEAEFITIERTAPRFTVKEGADGEVARSKNMKKSALVKIKFMQTSLANDDLAALVALGEDSVAGSDVGDFLMQDLEGNALVRADKAWVQKEPALGRGAEVGENEWEIYLAHAEFNPGGNPSV